MATPLTAGTLVTQAMMEADPDFDYTVTGPFRFDWQACELGITEYVDETAGFTKVHTPSSIDTADFSSIFPAGTKVRFSIKPKAGTGKTPYFKVRVI